MGESQKAEPEWPGSHVLRPELRKQSITAVWQVAGAPEGASWPRQGDGQEGVKWSRAAMMRVDQSGLGRDTGGEGMEREFQSQNH